MVGQPTALVRHTPPTHADDPHGNDTPRKEVAMSAPVLLLDAAWRIETIADVGELVRQLSRDVA
jgi:hypothetical protein